MTVNTTNITGFVVLPNDTVREKSSIIFRMTGFDTDADQDAVVVPYPITAPILSNGSINVRLWPNPEGVRATFYQVTASLYNGVNPVSVSLGQISVPVTGGPYDLNDLLPVAPPAGASVEDYIASLAAAVVASEASADAAAVSAADALSDAVRAEAAADLAEFYVPSIRPVVPLEPIISDGTLTSLTISGVYISADQIELYVGGVIQPARDEYYTITAGTTTTVLTFPAVEEGLEVYYRAMRQIAVPVADPGEIDFPDTTTADDLWQSNGDGITPLSFYGAVDDGTTDSATEINTALDDATKHTTVINGQYATSDTLTPISGRRMEGRNGASINKVSGGLTLDNLILPADDLTIKDVILNADVDAGAVNGVYLFDLRNAVDDLVIDGVSSDFGIVVNQIDGTRNGLGGIALFGNDSDVDGLTIRNSTFTRHFWGLLKANTTTGTERNFSITDSTFDEFGSSYLLFNSPATGSLIENVYIAGNNMGSVTSRQPFAGAIGFPHRGSFAGHVHYTRLIGNHAYGYGGEFFRAEEDAKASVWLGNTGKLNGKDGIEIIPNNANAEGTLYSPSMFVVGDNVMENTGLVASPTLGWGLGLQVYTGANATLLTADTLGESSIHDNVMKGWEQGYLVHQGGRRDLIHHNVAVDCAIGLQTWEPSTGMDDFMFTDCTVAIDAQRGGMMGKFHIRSASQDVPDPAQISIANGPLTVSGWTWETKRHDLLAATTREYELVEMGSYCNGILKLSLTTLTGTGSSYVEGRLAWNGTTLTFTETARKNVGGTVFSSTTLGIKNGNLAIAVFSAAGGSRIYVQAEFDGTHTWSA